ARRRGRRPAGGAPAGAALPPQGGGLGGRTRRPAARAGPGTARPDRGARDAPGALLRPPTPGPPQLPAGPGDRAEPRRPAALRPLPRSPRPARPQSPAVAAGAGPGVQPAAPDRLPAYPRGRRGRQPGGTLPAGRDVRPALRRAGVPGPRLRPHPGHRTGGGGGECQRRRPRARPVAVRRASAVERGEPPRRAGRYRRSRARPNGADAARRLPGLPPGDGPPHRGLCRRLRLRYGRGQAGPRGGMVL
ncbi:MAG: hypothetical protein AVDCRST_MAG88-2048, partial [uncultured Thermomicrobiales bacterium]